jgi:hypothetical protein
MICSREHPEIVHSYCPHVVAGYWVRAVGKDTSEALRLLCMPVNAVGSPRRPMKPRIVR